jgi:hypothetical protein
MRWRTIWRLKDDLEALCVLLNMYFRFLVQIKVNLPVFMESDDVCIVNRGDLAWHMWVEKPRFSTGVLSNMSGVGT